MSEEIKNDFFWKMCYKILEQIMVGKRKDVEYSITRIIFIVNGKALPSTLIEAFKPHYYDDTFRAFMYVFLGYAVGSDRKTSNRDRENQEVSDEQHNYDSYL